jgi:hypothetical protein
MHPLLDEFQVPAAAHSQIEVHKQQEKQYTNVVHQRGA